MKINYQFAKKYLSIILLTFITFQFQAQAQSAAEIQKYLNQFYSMDEASFAKKYNDFSQIEKLNLKTGDVVGISESVVDPSTIFFEAATASRYGHVGVVVKEKLNPNDQQETLMVYHANPPIVHRVSLKAFLGRASFSGSPLFTIMRPEPALSVEDSQALVKTMQAYMMKPTYYNKSQMINDNTLNCSEFVYKSFASIHRSVGTIEKMKDLNLKTFGGRLFEYFKRGGDVNTDADVVTPLSVIHSANLKLVFSTIPCEKLYSDFELHQLWDKEGSLAIFAEALGLDIKSMRAMGPMLLKSPYKTYSADQKAQICQPLN